MARSGVEPTQSSFLLAQATIFIASPAINGGSSRRAKSATQLRVNRRILGRPASSSILPGTIHRNQNLSKVPARSIELNMTGRTSPRRSRYLSEHGSLTSPSSNRRTATMLRFSQRGLAKDLSRRVVLKTITADHLRPPQWNESIACLGAFDRGAGAANHVFMTSGGPPCGGPCGSAALAPRRTAALGRGRGS